MSVSKAFCGIGSIIAFASVVAPSVFTPVGEAVTIKLSGGKRDTVDVTNMDSTSGYKEFIAALKDAGEIDIEANFVPDDSGQIGTSALYESGDKVNWKLTLPDERGAFTMTGIVIEDRNVDVPTDKKVTTSIKVKLSGPRDYVPFGS